MTAMKRLFLLLVLAACLPSCFDIPQLDVDTESVSLADEGGSERVRVTSNVDWTASASADWISIQYTTGGSSLTISATRNPGNSDRRGTVTLTGGDLLRTISVTQSSAPLQTVRTSITGVSAWYVPTLSGNGVSGTLSVASTTADYKDGLQLTSLNSAKTYVVRIDARYATGISFSTVEGIVEIDLSAF